MLGNFSTCTAFVLLGLLPLDFIRKPAFSLLAYKLVFLLLSACIIRKPAYIRFACNPIISHKHCPLHENHGFHKFHIACLKTFSTGYYMQSRYYHFSYKPIAQNLFYLITHKSIFLLFRINSLCAIQFLPYMKSPFLSFSYKLVLFNLLFTII